MKVETKIEFDLAKTAEIAEKAVNAELFSNRAKTILKRNGKNIHILIEGDRVACRASVNSILRLIDVCLQIDELDIRSSAQPKKQG
jgi:tRNA threonylcarbamoyladenosine modification (KEOPS) complex  Pcc1 subunit